MGLSTVLRKLRGIPVVRLIRGLLSNSRSLLVGQSCIQWPFKDVNHRYVNSANISDLSGHIDNTHN